MVRRPVVSRVPTRRRSNRWSVGVEHVGRRCVRMGTAKLGMFMRKPLPWLVWSYGERRLRRFHHASPFFATLLRLLTVKRAKVELSGVSCFVGTALSVARVSFTTVVFLTPPRRGSPRA